MKTRLIHLIFIFSIFMLDVAACSPARLTPQKIVSKMVERLNAGDVEGSLAYFADDAIIYFTGLPPTGMEIYRGKEQIRALWKDCASNHFKWEVEIISADKQIVTVRAKTWHDFTRQLGVAPNEYTDYYEIKNGKIVSYSSTLSQDSLAKLKPALLKAMPEAIAAGTTSAISTDAPATAVTVTISGGTCVYTGPMTLKAGAVKVNANVMDSDKVKYAVTFLTLNPGKDLVDLMAATTLPGTPAWSTLIFMKELNPNESQSSSFVAEAGQLYLVCWSKPPDIAIGNAGPFQVVP